MKTIRIPFEPKDKWVIDFCSQFNDCKHIRKVAKATHYEVLLNTHNHSPNLIQMGPVQLNIQNTDLNPEILPLWFLKFNCRSEHDLKVHFLPDASSEYLLFTFHRFHRDIRGLINNSSVYLLQKGYRCMIFDSAFDTQINIPANTPIESFSITLAKKWLRQLPIGQNELFLQHLGLPSKHIYLNELMSFPIQKLFHEVINNHLQTFVERLAFQEHLSAILRLIFSQMFLPQHSNPKMKLKQPDIQALLRVEKILLEDFKKAPTIKKLAAEAAMSSTKFKNTFKAFFGRNVYEYFLHYRMEKALELLQENKMNISAIAQELGYKNQTVFARTFKKHFGKLPSQYMKEN